MGPILSLDFRKVTLKQYRFGASQVYFKVAKNIILQHLGYFKFVFLINVQALRILELSKTRKQSCQNSERSGKETGIITVVLQFTFHWGKRWPQVVQMMEKNLVTCGAWGHRGSHNISIQSASNTLWWVWLFKELKFIKELVSIKKIIKKITVLQEHKLRKIPGHPIYLLKILQVSKHYLTVVRIR